MPSGNDTYISVIVPSYNKESAIETTLSRSVEFLNTRDYKWEIIVVDDASTDATLEKTRRFLADHPGLNIKLLEHERNQQKGAAIRTGIAQASGKYSLFLDADYAYPVNQVGNFLEHLEQGIPLVIGNRTDTRSIYLVKPFRFPYIYQRYLLGRAFNLLVRLFLLDGVCDTQCGLKAVRTDSARAIIDRMTIFNFSFDVEFLYIAKYNGLNVAQIPVTYDYIDEPSSVKLFRHSMVMLKSLVQIKLNSWTHKYQLDAERKS
jgi:dolichyl-phosphate beta-glucosyltransferase